MMAAMMARNTKAAKDRLKKATATAATKRLAVEQKRASLKAAKAAYNQSCKGNATAAGCTALKVRPERASERARARTDARCVCVLEPANGASACLACVHTLWSDT